MVFHVQCERQRLKADECNIKSHALVYGRLYVGTQQAYNQYKRDQQQKHLADEQQMTAEDYSDPAWNWGSWGSWGPWGPGYAEFGYGLCW
jgi:hypothetical protein